MDLKRKQFVFADLSCPFRWNTLLDITHTCRSTARRSTASTTHNADFTQSPLTTALASGLSLHCQERLNVMSSRHDPSINNRFVFIHTRPDRVFWPQAVEDHRLLFISNLLLGLGFGRLSLGSRATLKMA